MILERERSGFIDLEDVPANSAETEYLEFDFDAEDQAKVTRHQLEVFVTDAAERGSSDVPTLAIKVKTSEDKQSWTTIIDSPTFAWDDLEKGKVVYKGDFPESMERYVRVFAINAHASHTFSDGEIHVSSRPM